MLQDSSLQLLVLALMVINFCVSPGSCASFVQTPAHAATSTLDNCFGWVAVFDVGEIDLGASTCLTVNFGFLDLCHTNVAGACVWLYVSSQLCWRATMMAYWWDCIGSGIIVMKLMLPVIFVRSILFPIFIYAPLCRSTPLESTPIILLHGNCSFEIILPLLRFLYAW
jgi:hypothetical protein